MGTVAAVPARTRVNVLETEHTLSVEPADRRLDVRVGPGRLLGHLRTANKCAEALVLTVEEVAAAAVAAATTAATTSAAPAAPALLLLHDAAGQIAVHRAAGQMCLLRLCQCQH